MGDGRRIEADADGTAAAVADVAMEPPPAIGGNERRMHVRAYNFWVALLNGREFPPIASLDPAAIDDFRGNSVLLDFRADVHLPRIAWLGTALRDEGQMAETVATIADVPDRSLLSRLTEHYLQIMANRAPIGFEAEFVNARGNYALYRGILMPFSSDGRTIDYIYGVINWKELADPQTAAEIVAAARKALAEAPARPKPSPTAPVWADGPSRGSLDGGIGGGAAALFGTPLATVAETPLWERLALARDAANTVQSMKARTRTATHRALGIAYDLAVAGDEDPAGYAALLTDAGVTGHVRRPWQTIVRLVFEHDIDAGQCTAFACTLAHAWRQGVPPGGMRQFLDDHPGGIAQIVAAERTCRRQERG